MKVCCDNGKPISEMSTLDKLVCCHDHCLGPIEVEDFDLLLTGLGTFDTNECISYEDMRHLFKVKENEDVNDKN
jgi:hypothetical protein